jgi:hypothetical protein
MVGGTTLKPHKALWLATCAALLAATTNAWSNKPADFAVSGTVTVVRADTVTVDGRVYRIQPGSQAAAAASRVSTGQTVEVQLTGPANDSRTEAVAIRPR